ncbi:MAG: hypothetical protein QOF87_221 [Pseudonocardiales bacterium]|nr:hypothetical protein [Pseudonocardiales bacterium]
MTVCEIPSSFPTCAGPLRDKPTTPVGMPLPFSGWTLRWTAQPNGRTVIEINDDTDDLVGLVTSTNLPMLTVDAAWRGRGHDADGTRRWWALAVGHASATSDDPTVTFTRRIGAHGRAYRTDVVPQRLHGLWIAAVPGLHTTVTCRQGSEHRIRRLAAIPRLNSHV